MTLMECKAELFKRVESSDFGEWIDIEDINHLLKRVRFDHGSGVYEWTGEFSWKNGHRTGWSFPLMPGGKYVKTFKTEKGCKKNFITRWSDRWSFVGIDDETTDRREYETSEKGVAI